MRSPVRGPRSRAASARGRSCVVEAEDVVVYAVHGRGRRDELEDLGVVHLVCLALEDDVAHHEDEDGVGVDGRLDVDADDLVRELGGREGGKGEWVRTCS